MCKLYPFLFVFICYACNNARNADVNNGNVGSRDLSDNPFYGRWVSLRYLNALLQSKSPAKSQENDLFYEIGKRLSDTGYTFVYHEGGNQFIVLKKNNRYFKMSSDRDKKDEIFKISNDTIKIGADTFIRVVNNVGISEHYLFKGSYISGNKSVVFNDDGTIKGLDSNQYYFVVNDYIGLSMEKSANLIYIGNSKEKTSIYCFEFTKNALLIYDNKCLEENENKDCVLFGKGRLRYVLRKTQ